MSARAVTPPVPRHQSIIFGIDFAPTQERLNPQFHELALGLGSAVCNSLCASMYERSGMSVCPQRIALHYPDDGGAGQVLSHNLSVPVIRCRYPGDAQSSGLTLWRVRTTVARKARFARPENVLDDCLRQVDAVLGQTAFWDACCDAYRSGRAPVTRERLIAEVAESWDNKRVSAPLTASGYAGGIQRMAKELLFRLSGSAALPTIAVRESSVVLPAGMRIVAA